MYINSSYCLHREYGAGEWLDAKRKFCPHKKFEITVYVNQEDRITYRICRDLLIRDILNEGNSVTCLTMFKKAFEYMEQEGCSPSYWVSPKVLHRGCDSVYFQRGMVDTDFMSLWVAIGEVNGFIVHACYDGDSVLRKWVSQPDGYSYLDKIVKEYIRQGIRFSGRANFYAEKDFTEREQYTHNELVVWVTKIMAKVSERKAKKLKMSASEEKLYNCFYKCFNK